MEIRNRYGTYQIIDADGGVIAQYSTLEAAAVVLRFLNGIPQTIEEEGKAQAYIEAYDEEEQRRDAERQQKKAEARAKAAARKAARQAAADQGEGAAE